MVLQYQDPNDPTRYAMGDPNTPQALPQPNALPQNVYQPTTGETPLTVAPKYGGLGGGQQAADYYAWEAFTKQFGRNPTQSELSQLSSAYMSGDPNIANTSGGNAAVGQYFQSIASNPANQYAQQQSQYEKDAPKFYDKINGMYQQTVGREATEAEKKHFGSLLASGQVDDYQIGQFLTALPENVKKQDEEFRSGLNKTLQGQDAQYFNEQLMPGIQSNFAKQGRSVDSSAFSNSLALAGQQQNRQRESFLSGLTADQYKNSQGLAQNAYQQSYGNYQGLQDYSRQRGAQLQDALTGRVNQIQDFAMQKQAYDQYLSRYGKRQSGMGGGIGSLAGMGLGALLAAPTGGMSIPMGAMLGSSAGGAGGSLFDNY